MDTKNMLNQQADKVIEEHLPKIKKVIQEKVAPGALETAKDDKTMQLLLTPVYLALPLPVRLVIKKDMFMKFCFTHRDKLI